MPWAHIYYHMNSPSPCHIIRNYKFDMTPEEYVNSDWLKNLKKEMLSDTAPKACTGCKKKEDLGLKSTRGAVWNYYNMGTEPHYEDMWFYNKFTEDSPTDPYRMEFRFSNLCNMKCRMCDEASSSEWAKEKRENNLDFRPLNTSIKLDSDSIGKTKEQSIEELKQLALTSKNLRKICLTGGEPFIIKEYYDYLDFLIDNNLSKKIELEIFTNCSVYNPLFIDRLKHFKKVELVMSIDAVGKPAEYIRHGTSWEKIEKNIIRLNKLGGNINSQFNTALSSYALLNISALAAFLMKLHKDNPKIFTKCYHTIDPVALNAYNLPQHLKQVAIEEIDKAIEILGAGYFDILSTELKNSKKTLSEKQGDPSLFYSFTEQYDSIRNESFESTFNIPLQV